jgi:hypothetical protein
LKNCLNCGAKGHWEWDFEVWRSVNKILKFNSQFQHNFQKQQINYIESTPNLEAKDKIENKFEEEFGSMKK